MTPTNSKLALGRLTPEEIDNILGKTTQQIATLTEQLARASVQLQIVAATIQYIKDDLGEPS